MPSLGPITNDDELAAYIAEIVANAQRASTEEGRRLDAMYAGARAARANALASGYGPDQAQDAYDAVRRDYHKARDAEREAERMKRVQEQSAMWAELRGNTNKAAVGLQQNTEKESYHG